MYSLNLWQIPEMWYRI